MTKEITIQGVPFKVTEPYAAGHAISEAAAKALNQTRAENIGNNCAKLVKEAQKNAGEGNALSEDVLTSLAQHVTEYDKGYEFTLASVGGGRASRDPIEIEATKIARAAITAQLRKNGKKVSEVDADALKAKIAEVAAMPNVMKAAKKAVAERTNLAEEALTALDL